MSSSDPGTLTLEQATTNEQAINGLTRGKRYQFDPPVTATGIATGGSQVCEDTEMSFKSGWYIGFTKGRHVFQGKPINDPRSIPDRFRGCYFYLYLDFVGGSSVTPDPT